MVIAFQGSPSSSPHGGTPKMRWSVYLGGDKFAMEIGIKDGWLPLLSVGWGCSHISMQGLNLLLYKAILTACSYRLLWPSSCCVTSAGIDLTMAIHLSRCFINTVYCSETIPGSVNRTDQQKLTWDPKMKLAKGNYAPYIFISTAFLWLPNILTSQVLLEYVARPQACSWCYDACVRKEPEMLCEGRTLRLSLRMSIDAISLTLSCWPWTEGDVRLADLSRGWDLFGIKVSTLEEKSHGGDRRTGSLWHHLSLDLASPTPACTYLGW